MHLFLFPFISNIGISDAGFVLLSADVVLNGMETVCVPIPQIDPVVNILRLTAELTIIHTHADQRPETGAEAGNYLSPCNSRHRLPRPEVFNPTD